MLVHSRLAHSCFAVHVIYWFVCGLHSHMDKDYIGEYCGHGQSKTAFILKGAPGDPYNGKILKVTAKPDIEPLVFTKMTERSPGITSRILYSSLGYGSNQQRYYCWITERTIPLDQMLNLLPDVARDRCILAAMMRCADFTRWRRFALSSFFHFSVFFLVKTTD